MGVELCAGEDFDGREASGGGRKVVPYVNSMLHGVGPKSNICVFWPVQRGVDEHGAGPLGDSADGAFCYAVLMVGADAGEGLLLVLVLDVG